MPLFDFPLKIPLFVQTILADISTKQTPLFMKILTTSLFAALALPAAADILTLKDGTKLDATILEKNLEEYKLEVNVTKSIKELRTIKRSEVVNVEATNQSAAIFEDTIKDLAPAPPFLDLAGYDSRIKTIKAFLRKHKVTTAGTKATTMLSDLEEERKFIADGGIKISLEPSGLISAEDREKDAVGIASNIEAQKFKDLVESRSYLAALRQYDVVERSYMGTAAHREVLPLMSRFVESYAALLSRELENAALREGRLEVTLDQLPASDRQRAIQAEELRIRNLEAIRQQEEEENQSWLTVDPHSVESLEETIQVLEEESERLAQVSDEVAEMDDLAKLYREGWVAAGEKKTEELEGILDAMEYVGASEDLMNTLVDRFDPTINNPPAEEGTDDEAAEEDGMEENMEEGMKEDMKESMEENESDISE